MKVKVYVIDLEIPPRVKRWALRIGIPAVVLTVAVVALAAPLHTWNNGDPLNATDLNGNFSNLQSQIVPITAWQTWTPTFVTADGKAIDNAAATGSYRRVGDTMEFFLGVSFSGPSGSSSSQIWTASLPSGLQVDTSKLAFEFAGSGDGPSSAPVVKVSTHNNAFYFGIAGGVGNISSQYPSAGFQAGDGWAVSGAVPIAGW